MKWLSCFYIVEIKPSSAASFANIFFQSVGCLFVFCFLLLYRSLQVWLDPVCLFLLWFLLPGKINLRKHWYYLRQKMFCLCFLLGVLFKSLSHSEFIFVYVVRVCSNFTDLHVAVQLFQHNLLKTVASSIKDWLTSVWSLLKQVCGFISRLSILFHWFICLFLYQYYDVFDNCSFVVLFEVWEGYASCFGILSLL